MFACLNGYIDVVQSLLKYSKDREIDLNARDNFGRTALMIAFEFCHKDVVQFLLQHSNVTDIKISNREQESSTSLKNDTNPKNVENVPESIETVSVLNNRRQKRRQKLVLWFASCLGIREFVKNQ